MAELIRDGKFHKDVKRVATPRQLDLFASDEWWVGLAGGCG
ncbi:MAG: hypothetical protein OXE52_10925 [Chloroflexi bacterium]|nr:hypothetical protein [Chloroflexota bacterium]